MSELKQMKLYGDINLQNRGGIISFNLGDIHPHDLATILNEHCHCNSFWSPLCPSVNGKARCICNIQD